MSSRTVTICLTLIVALLSFGSALAQNPSSRLEVSCGGPFHLCGFIDRDTKAEVIPKRYELVVPFSEGLAAIRAKGRYGYIDESGVEVIRPQFELAGQFVLGLAEVVVGNKSGIIDRSGKIVVKPQFARAQVLTKDVLMVRDEAQQWSNDAEFEVPRPLTAVTLLKPIGAWRLFHVRNGWIGKPEFTFHRFEGEGRGLVWATRVNLGGRLGPFGLMRADGTWQIEPRFTEVAALMNGRANVRLPDPAAPPGRHAELRGTVDGEGYMVVAPANRHFGDWRNGFSVVQEAGRFGLLDEAGNLVSRRMFEWVERPETGDVAKVLLDGKWVGLTRDGRILGAHDNGKVIGACPSGVKMVWMDGQVEVRGADDKPTAPYRFDRINGSQLHCDKPTRVVTGWKLDLRTSGENPAARWGYVGLDGRLLHDPLVFQGAHDFADGHAIVKLKDKWGIIDTSGRYTVAPRYTYISPTTGGLFAVAEDKRSTFITAKGESRPEPRPSADDRLQQLKCHGGLEIYNSTGWLGWSDAWGIRNSAGKVVIAAKFRAIHCFASGVAWAAIDSGKAWCPIGPDGMVREQPACVTQRLPPNVNRRPSQMSDDDYESSVLWTRALYDYAIGRRDTPPPEGSGRPRV